MFQVITGKSLVRWLAGLGVCYSLVLTIWIITKPADSYNVRVLAGDGARVCVVSVEFAVQQGTVATLGHVRELQLSCGSVREVKGVVIRCVCP